MTSDSKNSSKATASGKDVLDSKTDKDKLLELWNKRNRNQGEIDPEELAAYVKSKVIGQDPVVDTICKRLHFRMAAKRPNKPKAVFCFAGAPGIGKTYLAQVLAVKLFGSPKHLHHFSMEQFQEAHSASTLFGSPQGYEGGTGSLSKALRDVPNSIILLDEFEKAHRLIHTRFLSAWNDGFLVDVKDGLRYPTTDTVFVMTVNTGSRQIAERARDPRITQEELNAFAKNALQDAKFPPEVLSRIDDVFAFRELEGLDIARVVALEIEKATRTYSLEVAGQGIDPEILMSAIDVFTQTRPEGGVRQIARHIEDKIAGGLIEARKIGATHVMFEADGDDVRVIPVDEAGNALAAEANETNRTATL